MHGRMAWYCNAGDPKSRSVCAADYKNKKWENRVETLFEHCFNRGCKSISFSSVGDWLMWNILIVFLFDDASVYICWCWHSEHNSKIQTMYRSGQNELLLCCWYTSKSWCNNDHRESSRNQHHFNEVWIDQSQIAWCLLHILYNKE